MELQKQGLPDITRVRGSAVTPSLDTLDVPYSLGSPGLGPCC
jgi:hypothetical protein